MESTNRFEGIDAYAAELIRHKARQLSRRPEFTETDKEDLEQEMILDLLARLPQYDPQRATRNTFIARVVEHKVSKLISFQHAQRRDVGRQAHSLNAAMPENRKGESERIDCIDENAHHRRMGAASRTETQSHDLRLDVGSALRDLPEPLRKICELLQHKTIAEISRDTGIPRATIYDAIQKVKAKLSGVDLDY